MTDLQRCVVPGGGSGTATAFLLDSTFGFRSGYRERRSFKLEGFGAGLTDRKPGRLSLSSPAKCDRSPLAGHPTAEPLLLRGIPAHSRGPEFSAWDCKVTPADWACQERNTTCCIPSNDGPDASVEPSFPHCGKLGSGWVRPDSHLGTLIHGAGWGAVSQKVLGRSSRDLYSCYLFRPSRACCLLIDVTHGLRPGLHSYAALRLRSGQAFAAALP